VVEGAFVEAVHVDGDHHFSKPTADAITLVAGMGVLGDAHFGATVQHRSRVAADPAQPNLRQVHLVQAELLDALHGHGFAVVGGAVGENITTRGIDLLAQPTGTLLRLGDDALIALTGVRTPCGQLNGLQPGLLDAFRRVGNGVMAVVVQGGVVRAGDPIGQQLPPAPHHPLARV